MGIGAIMGNFISDEEMAKLEGSQKPKNFISDEEMAKLEAQQSQEESSLHKAGRLTAEYLPMAGSIAGGVLGSAAMNPYTAIAGAGLGGAIGASGGEIIKHLIDEPVTEESLTENIKRGALTGAAGEMGGQLVAAAIPAAGRALYKSGIPNYVSGKVKDVLLGLKAIGSREQLAEALQPLVKKEMDIVHGLAKKAAEKGGTVDMAEAMRPAIAKIREIRASKDPALQELADELQKQVGSYLKLQGKPASVVIKEIPTPPKFNPAYSEVSFKTKTGSLPVQGEFIPSSYEVNPIPGKTIPEQFLEKPEIPYSYTETIPGKTYPESYTQLPAKKTAEFIPATKSPSVMQGLGYKRTINEGIPGNAWAYNAGNPSWIEARMDLSSGMKSATETTIGETLGTEAQKQFMRGNEAAGELIEAQKLLRSGFQQEGKQLLSPAESAVVAMKPAIGIPGYLAKKGIEKYPMELGLKMANLGQGAQRQAIASAVSLGLQGVNSALASPNMTRAESMAIGAYQQGVPPFIIDKEISKAPQLKPTEKAQLRKQLSEKTR